jgi:hypothetical protein
MTGASADGHGGCRWRPAAVAGHQRRRQPSCPIPRIPWLPGGFFLEQRARIDFIGQGRRPNPGADETVKVPYDISGRRLQ